MKIKCDWCGRWINDFDQACPSCGGVNRNFRRQADGVPRTVAELSEWAKKHNLPLRQMNTYIGQDYRGPRAFGIYRDGNGNFVVYKNKADGTRAVRYEGPDEAYAVNELYQKMKERVSVQKQYMAGHQTYAVDVPYLKAAKATARFGRMLLRGIMAYVTVFVIVMALFIGMTLFADRSPYNGYYHYHGETYYWQDAWYVYGDGWERCYDDLDYLYDNYSDYRVYSYYDYGVEDFADSVYYVEPSYDDDDDWDDDYDWDDDWDWDDSWDDWDSDW